MPAGNLEEVTLRSDKHSSPSLAANHLSPLSTVANFPPSDSTGGSGGGGTGLLAGRFGAPNSSQFAPDALDYYGYWKLLDGLLDAAFLGRNREYALGGTVQQRFMGVASDGVPVVPLEVAAPLQSGSP